MFVHCWFSTKRRRRALVGEVQMAAIDALRDAAERHGVALIEVGCMVDHVHLLLNVAEIGHLPSIMHLLKAAVRVRSSN